MHTAAASLLVAAVHSSHTTLPLPLPLPPAPPPPLLLLQLLTA
jgi:hypothetical protein